MYCFKCGTDVGEGAGFCTKCGQDQRVVSVKKRGWWRQHLVEIVIFLLISGILGSIAVPNYVLMKRKSRQSEAKVILKGLFTAQMSYFGENQRYGTTFDEVGFKLYRDPDYYCFYLSEHEVLPLGCSTRIPDGIEGAFVNQTSFRAVAVGNIDWDSSLDVWTIDSNNRLVIVINDAELL